METFLPTGYCDSVNVMPQDASAYLDSFGFMHNKDTLAKSTFTSRGNFWKLKLHHACLLRGFIPIEFFSCSCAQRVSMIDANHHLLVPETGGVVSSYL